MQRLEDVITENRRRSLRCLWIVISIVLWLAILPRLDAPQAAGGMRSSETAGFVTRPPQDLGDGWQRSTPAAEGLDVGGLSEVYTQAQALPYLHSFLVVRHGKLVSEWYFDGYTVHVTDNVKSVSKSILSALMGIALREGYLTRVDQKLKTFLPAYFPEGMEPRKYAITLKHLLTMSSGLGPPTGAGIQRGRRTLTG